MKLFYYFTDLENFLWNFLHVSYLKNFLSTKFHLSWQKAPNLLGRGVSCRTNFGFVFQNSSTTCPKKKKKKKTAKGYVQNGEKENLICALLKYSPIDSQWGFLNICGLSCCPDCFWMYFTVYVEARFSFLLHDSKFCILLLWFRKLSSTPNFLYYFSDWKHFLYYFSGLKNFSGQFFLLLFRFKKNFTMPIGLMQPHVFDLNESAMLPEHDHCSVTFLWILFTIRKFFYS